MDNTGFYWFIVDLTAAAGFLVEKKRDRELWAIHSRFFFLNNKWTTSTGKRFIDAPSITDGKQCRSPSPGPKVDVKRPKKKYNNNKINKQTKKKKCIHQRPETPTDRGLRGSHVDDDDVEDDDDDDDVEDADDDDDDDDDVDDDDDDDKPAERGFTKLYWVLPGFTEFLVDFIGFSWILLSVTGFYWVLLGFTGFCRL